MKFSSAGWLIGTALWLGLSASVAYAGGISLPRAIEEKRWALAMPEARKNGAVADYVEWRDLLERDDAGFATLSRFIRNHRDWPYINVLQQKAEKALFQEYTDKQAALRWLSDFPPISGYGKFVAIRHGSGDRGRLLQEAWVQGDFEREDELKLREHYRAELQASWHKARIERLLSEGKASVAERHLSLMDSAHQALYRAAIALIRTERNPEQFINRVPAGLRAHDALVANRLLWRQRKGLVSGVEELLPKINADSLYADAIWRIRASIARDLIESKRYDRAMQFLQNAGNRLNASNMADALWLKGWVEYEFRRNYQAAYQHFTALHKAVKYPVSLSRGAYWAARAAEKMGQAQQAQQWDNIAANYTTTFYGQLAFAKRHPGKALTLHAAAQANASFVSQQRNRPLVRVALWLYDKGLDGEARSLIVHLAESAKKEQEWAALAAIFVEKKALHPQVLIAKGAIRENVQLLPYGWPRTSLPNGLNCEPSLVLAISRQESEYNPKAISHADARGTMQLIPETARRTAQKLGMVFQLPLLFEPAYNMTLGAKYIGDLINGFDGSYILAIASYNAGPGRAREWKQRFGRPGQNLEQTLRWIELIPFAETRNYVQRVLENVQVYRSLQSPNAPLHIEKDLLR